MEVGRRRLGPPRWPDQKLARPTGRGPSQACLAVTCTRAGAGQRRHRRGDIAMPIVAEHYQFVIGVDTHAASHAFAIIHADTSAVRDRGQFPATTAGLARSVTWVGRRIADAGSVIVVIEGVGSYGVGVAWAFTSAGYRVVEADRQSAADRHGVGKSDALNAIRITRSVLARDMDDLREPRADGARNALRILLSSRMLMTRESTTATNALTALVRTEALGIYARKALTLTQVKQIAAWRTRSSDSVDAAVARAQATRLARRVLELRDDLKANERQVHDLVQQTAPSLLTMTGVGPVTAAVGIAAWSHRGRVRSEAAFAALAGTCPIPASSGNTQRHRLNRGGDRRLNWALHTIIMVRMGRDPRTKDYIARRISEGKTKKEAMRCAKRHLTKTPHRTLMREPALAT